MGGRGVCCLQAARIPSSKENSALYIHTCDLASSSYIFLLVRSFCFPAGQLRQFRPAWPVAGLFHCQPALIPQLLPILSPNNLQYIRWGGREESADNLLHPALHATRPSGTYFHLLWNQAVSLSYLTILFCIALLHCIALHCNLAFIRIFLLSLVPELLATWLLSSHI